VGISDECPEQRLSERIGDIRYPANGAIGVSLRVVVEQRATREVGAMKSIAVCCGFNHYEGAPALGRAVNDAALLYGKLTANTAFNSDPSVIGLGELFTQKTSADAILAALGRAAAGPAELVWFSFSGHAAVCPGGELRLLLPEWRSQDSDAEQRRFSLGARELEEVWRPHLRRKKLLILLDTCHSGAFGGDVMSRDVSPGLESRVASAGAVVISSCSSGQLALDGHAGDRELYGAFTSGVLEVLDEHMCAGDSLTVLALFLAAKRKITNGQVPTLHVNGLTDDFLVLARTAGPALAPPEPGISRMQLDVPSKLVSELESFLSGVVEINRNQRIGLAHAKRELAGLANEVSKYQDDIFTVPDHNANATEAFDRAHTYIIGCTTPAYFDEWRRSGIWLCRANEEFVKNGGHVTRFFFVRRDFRDRVPHLLEAVRDQLRAGIRVVVVHVDSYGPTVLQEVLKNPRPDDLSALECAFVDGEVFLKTHFVANGDLTIEVDQRALRCRSEYKARLRPFLDSRNGTLSIACFMPGNDKEVVLAELTVAEVDRLKQELDVALGVADGEPGAASAPRRRAS
jgi:hypothetical protein